MNHRQRATIFTSALMCCTTLWSPSVMAQAANDTAIQNTLEQSFQQATQANASGDLDIAIRTYETMLANNPELDRVRLDMGLALFRVGKLAAAKEQFNIVLEKQIPDTVRRNIEAVMKQIAQAEKEHHFSGSAIVGMNFDTNGNSASSTGKATVLGNDFILSPQDTRKSDAQGFASVTVRHRWQPMASADNPKPSALAWKSDVTGYKTEQDTLDNLNISLFTLHTGPEYTLLDGALTLGLTGGYTDVILAGSTYMHIYALEASSDYYLNKQHMLSLALTNEYRDFFNSNTSSSFEDRKGQGYQAKMGYSYYATPQDIFSLNLQLRTEETRVSYYNNWSWTPEASYTHQTKEGYFAQFSVGYKDTEYFGADPFVSTRIREDWEKNFGMNFGVPLTDKVTWLLGYTYRFTDSTLQNYQSDNQRVSTTLAARF